MTTTTETKTLTATVSLFGEEREVEFYDWGNGRERLNSRGLVVVGRFPTGAKLHASSLTLWKREQSNGRLLPGPVAATIDGESYVADKTLYIHNSNRGRLVAWNDDLADSGWRS